jgi:hypothetical protein
MTYLNERWEDISRRASRHNLPAALIVALLGLVLFVVGLTFSSVAYEAGAAVAFAGLLLFGLFGMLYHRTAGRR